MFRVKKRDENGKLCIYYYSSVFYFIKIKVKRFFYGITLKKYFFKFHNNKQVTKESVTDFIHGALGEPYKTKKDNQ